jgi:hypothetical protein
MVIRRLDEIRDETGQLTHKMCCICFEMVPLRDLWRDVEGQQWDLCSDVCAAKARGDDDV